MNRISTRSNDEHVCTVKLSPSRSGSFWRQSAIAWRVLSKRLMTGAAQPVGVEGELQLAGFKLSPHG
jgi:hypothetical protein